MYRVGAGGLAAALGIVACAPAGQRPLSETERNAVADSIKAVSAGWRDAGQRADAPAILGYYLNSSDAAIARADDPRQTTLGYEAFAIGLPAGLQSTKSQVLTVTDQRVTVLDRDAAAETAVGTWASTDTAGKASNAHFAYTRVWVRRDGAWKILHSHLALLPLQAPVEAQTPQFEFAGLSPRTTIDDLKSRYPSSHFDRSPGGASVRVVPGDVHDHIYFIALNTRAASLRLSFERPAEYVQNLPADWAAQHRARQPPCAPILGQLSEAYGAPDSERSWSEEALEHLTRYWFTEHEQLRLDCYQPAGTGDVLASTIHICPRQEAIRLTSPCS